MTEHATTWNDVGNRFGALGLKLRYHFQQAGAREGGEEGDGEGSVAAGDVAAAAGATDTPAAPSEHRHGGDHADGDGLGERVNDALRRLAGAIDEVVDAVGAAVKDPAVREDVRGVSVALSEAIAGSIGDVSGDLRRALRRDRGDGEAGDPAASVADDGDAAGAADPTGATDAATPTAVTEEPAAT